MPTQEETADKRAAALRLYAMNTRLDALDGQRAEMRATRDDDKTSLYYQKRMGERLKTITSDDPQQDPTLEAVRQRYRTGMNAIEQAAPEDLDAIIESQQRTLRERLAREGLDATALDRDSSEPLSDRAITRLREIEGVLIEREMIEGIRRDAILQDPEYRADIAASAEKSLKALDYKLAPYKLEVAEQGNPVRLLPPEFPPFKDENGQDLPPLPRDPAPRFTPVPPGGAPFMPPRQQRAPQQSPDFEMLPPPPAEEPAPRPDPASRKLEDLRKILGPDLLKEGDEMKWKEEKKPETKPKIAAASEFGRVLAMTDEALLAAAGSMPAAAPQAEPQTEAPSGIPARLGARSLA